MAEKLISIKDVSGGWNPDSTPEELLPNQWTKADNYRFRDGCLERVKGMGAILNVPTITPYYIGPYSSTTTRFWVYAGTQQVFVDDGTTKTEITPLTTLPAVVSASAVGTTVTVTQNAHGRTTGDSIVLDGFTPAAYNGTFIITVTGVNTYTYTALTAPGGPATVVGLAWLNVTQFLTGGIDDRITGGTFNGTFVFNNGTDQPFYWGGDITKRMRILPGWDPTHRAGVVRPFKTHLIALDITKGVGTTPIRYPNMLKGSWAAVPGAVPAGWDPSNAGQDGIERDLAETSDYMVDGKAMGDVFIVYKTTSTYAVRESFSNSIYISQRIPGGNGMLTRGCVVDTPKGHVVLTNGDLVLHQGGLPVSIAEGRVKRWIFSTLDASKLKRAFLVANPKCKEVWICFPSLMSDACDTAVMWNYEENTFGKRSLLGVTYGASGLLPITATSGRWIDDTTSWISKVTSWTENEYSPSEEGLMVARTAPEISLVEVGGTDSGAFLLDALERVGFMFDDPYTVKSISMVRPRTAALSGTKLGISVGKSSFAGGATSYKPPVTFFIGQQSEATQFSDGGIYPAVRFSRSDVDPTPIQPWRMRSYDVPYIELGRY